MTAWLSAATVSAPPRPSSRTSSIATESSREAGSAPIVVISAPFGATLSASSPAVPT
jgi:hypothetical protein